MQSKQSKSTIYACMYAHINANMQSAKRLLQCCLRDATLLDICGRNLCRNFSYYGILIWLDIVLICFMRHVPNDPHHSLYTKWEGMNHTLFYRNPCSHIASSFHKIAQWPTSGSLPCWILHYCWLWTCDFYIYLLY